MFTNAAVEVITVESLEIFTDAGFNSDTENLVFVTKENMTVVQIFNSEGVLEFQLPVMSNNVQINKNLFGPGKYKVAFLLDGASKVHFTQVTVK